MKECGVKGGNKYRRAITNSFQFFMSSLVTDLMRLNTRTNQHPLITDTMCLDHIVTPIGGNLKLGVRVGCLLDGYRVCSLRLWLLMYQVE